MSPTFDRNNNSLPRLTLPTSSEHPRLCSTLPSSTINNINKEFVNRHIPEHHHHLLSLPSITPNSTSEPIASPTRLQNLHFHLESSISIDNHSTAAKTLIPNRHRCRRSITDHLRHHLPRPLLVEAVASPLNITQILLSSHH